MSPQDTDRASFRVQGGSVCIPEGLFLHWPPDAGRCGWTEDLTHAHVCGGGTFSPPLVAFLTQQPRFTAVLDPGRPLGCRHQQDCSGQSQWAPGGSQRSGPGTPAHQGWWPGHLTWPWNAGRSHSVLILSGGLRGFLGLHFSSLFLPLLP